MRVAPASRRHLGCFRWLERISSIKQAILAFEKNHKSLKQTPAKVPKIANWVICIHLRIHLLSKLRLNIHRLTSVVDKCHGPSPAFAQPRHKCRHWHIQGAPQSNLNDEWWRPDNKVIQQHKDKMHRTAPKIQNRKILFRRVSIWQVQENTSRPYRHALDSKAQGHRGSCTHAKSNSMCNGGIAQGEQYGGGQTAEQPQSNAPMHHCTTARSTQFDAFCTFPENGSVKTWTLSASMSLYGGECLDHATNSKVPDSHGAEIRWIELWRFNIRQQKAV